MAVATAAPPVRVLPNADPASRAAWPDSMMPASRERLPMASDAMNAAAWRVSVSVVIAFSFERVQGRVAAAARRPGRPSGGRLDAVHGVGLGMSAGPGIGIGLRSEEHTSELQSLMRTS